MDNSNMIAKRTFMKHNKKLLFLLFSLQIDAVLAAPITFGTGTKADTNSIAIGEDAWAIQTAGHDTLYATGQVAIGYHAKATGLASTAYGAYSLATGFKSSAYGDYSQANGYKSTAFGPDALANGDYSTAFGSASQSNGLNSLAIGANSLVSKDNSVALGSGSVADTGSQLSYVGYMLSQPQTSNGEFSIGSATVKRKITNVAAGQNDTDATNVQQLKSVNDSLTSKMQFNSDRAVNYDLNQDGSINLLSLSLNKGSGNVVLRGVANGAVNSTSTEAVNGSQLYQTNQQVSQLQDSLSSLYTMVGTTNAKLDATAAETAQNTQNISDTNTKLDATTTQTDKNTQSINDTNTKLDTTTAQTDKNTQSINDTNTKLDTNIVQTDKNTQSINDTNTKLDTTTAQTDKNTQNINDTNTKLDTTNNNVTKNTNDIANLANTPPPTNTGATPEDIKNAEDIANTNTELGKTNTQVAKNTQDIVQNTKDIGQNSQDISKNTQDIVQNSKDITKNTQDIVQNSKDITKNTQDIVQNSKDINQNSQDIIQNSKDITKNTQSIDINSKNISENTKDIVKNTQDISDTNIKVNKLDNKTVQYDQDGSGNNLNKITLKGQKGSVISNLADGKEDSDAVNVKQLKTVSNQTEKNSANIKNISEGKAGMVIVNNTSNKANPIATGKDSIAIGQGSKSTGKNSVAIGADSTDGGRENTVSVGNSTTRRTLSNVSAGTYDTDAVNVSQLNAQVNSALNSANAYTDSLFSGLNSKIDKVDRQNKAGIASAMAMATMPQAYDPGDSMVSVGVGAYSSESAISVGASVASPKGRFIYKINGSMDSRGTAGAAAGVGYKW
jgi:autotransporter adhesin